MVACIGSRTGCSIQRSAASHLHLYRDFLSIGSSNCGPLPIASWPALPTREPRESLAMRKLFRAQMDLFATEVRPADLSGAEREKVVALLQALLREALATKAETASAPDTAEMT